MKPRLRPPALRTAQSRDRVGRGAVAPVMICRAPRDLAADSRYLTSKEVAER